MSSNFVSIEAQYDFGLVLNKWFITLMSYCLFNSNEWSLSTATTSILGNSRCSLATCLSASRHSEFQLDLKYTAVKVACYYLRWLWRASALVNVLTPGMRFLWEEENSLLREINDLVSIKNIITNVYSISFITIWSNIIIFWYYVTKICTKNCKKPFKPTLGGILSLQILYGSPQTQHNESQSAQCLYWSLWCWSVSRTSDKPIRTKQSLWRTTTLSSNWSFKQRLCNRSFI